MLRIGLTGGIASGKSYVLSRLARAGFATIDLDRVGHQAILSGQPAHRELVAAFGPGILAGDGEIDRAVLGRIVFAEPDARRVLDAIVHPRILAAEAREAAALAGRSSVVVTDGSLLVEGGYHTRFRRLVVVHCDPAVQKRRLMDRDGLDEAAAAARLDAQMAPSRKVSFAHHAIDTSGTFTDVDRVVDALAAEIGSLPRVTGAPLISREQAVGCLTGVAGSPGARGLDATSVARNIVGWHGLALQALQEAQSPPWPGAWFEGPQEDTRPDARPLMGPLVLANLAVHDGDPVHARWAAASLSLAVHVGPPQAAEAVAYAEVLREAAVTRRLPDDLEGLVGGDAGLRRAVVGIVEGLVLSSAPAATVDLATRILDQGTPGAIRE